MKVLNVLLLSGFFAVVTAPVAFGCSRCAAQDALQTQDASYDQEQLQNSNPFYPQ